MGASTLAHSAHPETPQPLHQPLLAHELTGFLGLSLTREMSLQLKIAQRSPAKLPAPTAMQRMGRFYERFVHPQTYCLGWDFGPCSSAGSMQVCKWGWWGTRGFLPIHPAWMDVTCMACQESSHKCGVWWDQGVASYQCAQYLPCIAQPIMWESVRVPMGIGISTAQGDVTGV